MDMGEEHADYVPPIKRTKKMKHSSGHIVQVTPNQLQTTNQNIDMSEYQNDADQDRSLYTKFTEDLLTQGNIKWWFHDEQTDICMMNDVDKETGVMKPNSFIHVTYTTDETGEIMLTCTCKIFDFICRTAHQHNPSWPLEETIPHTSFTCLHCRYFKEHLINAYMKS